VIGITGAISSPGPPLATRAQGIIPTKVAKVMINARYNPNLSCCGLMIQRIGVYIAENTRNPIRSLVVMAADAGSVFSILIKDGNIASSRRLMA
jgi:hypothetical protein